MAGVMMIDLSAAFDMVDHDILIKENMITRILRAKAATKLGIILSFLSFHILFSHKGFA